MATSRRELRRVLLDLALRRQRPGSGSSLAFLKERTTRLQVPDLTRALSGVLWAVAGASAARAYMPERGTQDLDIAILPASAAEVARRLREAGLRRTGALAIGGSCWKTKRGFPIDVAELDRPWAQAALEEAQGNILPPGLPVLTLPYLVLMKLDSSRAIDLADLARILGQAGPADIERVRSLVRHHAPEDLTDLESLITLGRLELEG